MWHRVAARTLTVHRVKSRQHGRLNSLFVYPHDQSMNGARRGTVLRSAANGALSGLQLAGVVPSAMHTSCCVCMGRAACWTQCRPWQTHSTRRKHVYARATPRCCPLAARSGDKPACSSDACVVVVVVTPSSSCSRMGGASPLLLPGRPPRLLRTSHQPQNSICTKSQ